MAEPPTLTRRWSSMGSLPEGGNIAADDALLDGFDLLGGAEWPNARGPGIEPVQGTTSDPQQAATSSHAYRTRAAPPATPDTSRERSNDPSIAHGPRGSASSAFYVPERSASRQCGAASRRETAQSSGPLEALEARLLSSSATLSEDASAPWTLSDTAFLTLDATGAVQPALAPPNALAPSFSVLQQRGAAGPSASAQSSPRVTPRTRLFDPETFDLLAPASEGSGALPSPIGSVPSSPAAAITAQSSGLQQMTPQLGHADESPSPPHAHAPQTPSDDSHRSCSPLGPVTPDPIPALPIRVSKLPLPRHANDTDQLEPGTASSETPADLLDGSEDRRVENLCRDAGSRGDPPTPGPAAPLSPLGFGAPPIAHEQPSCSDARITGAAAPRDAAPPLDFSPLDMEEPTLDTMTTQPSGSPPSPAAALAVRAASWARNPIYDGVADGARDEPLPHDGFDSPRFGSLQHPGRSKGGDASTEFASAELSSPPSSFESPATSGGPSAAASGHASPRPPHDASPRAGGVRPAASLRSVTFDVPEEQLTDLQRDAAEIGDRTEGSGSLHEGTLNTEDEERVAAFLGRMDSVQLSFANAWNAEQALRNDELMNLPADSAPAQDARVRSPREAEERASDGGLALAPSYAEQSVDYDVSAQRLESEAALADAYLRVEVLERQLKHKAEQASDLQAALGRAEDDLFELRSRSSARGTGGSSFFATHSAELCSPTAAQASPVTALDLQAATSAVAELDSLLTLRLEPAMQELVALRCHYAAAQNGAGTEQHNMDLPQLQQHVSAHPDTFQAQKRLTASELARHEADDLFHQLRASLAAQHDLERRVEELQRRNGDLEALAAGGAGGAGGAIGETVPYAVHRALQVEKGVLDGQIAQLRADLQMLYMDEAFLTRPGPLDTEGGPEGAARSASVSTAARLAMLLSSHATTLPESLMHTLSNGSRAAAVLSTSTRLPSTHSPAISLPRTPSEPMSPERHAPSLPPAKAGLPPLAPQTPPAALHRLRSKRTSSMDRLEASNAIASLDRQQSSAQNQSGSLSTPKAGATPDTVFQEPTFDSVARSESGSAVPRFAEHSKEKLAELLEAQASALAERDTIIAALKVQLRDATQTPPATHASQALSGQSSPRGGARRIASAEDLLRAARDSRQGSAPASVQGADDEQKWYVGETRSWTELPVPETFRQALEQIVILQLENARLRDASFDDTGELSLGHCDDAPPDAVESAPSRPQAASATASGRGTLNDRQKLAESWGHINSLRQQLMKTRNAMRTLASYNTLGQAIESSNSSPTAASGRLPMSPDSSAAPDPSSLEVEVFKDAVLKELSAKIVEWQGRHDEVSESLVAANMRLAEMSSERDGLQQTIRALVEEAERLRAAQARASEGEQAKPKQSKGFFGRLKTPRSRNSK